MIMELLLAKQSMDSRSKSIDIDAIQAGLDRDDTKIYYFDQSNSHKDLLSVVDNFESRGYSVYLREVKYGLDESEYMYEMHLL
jgi:pyruvate/oxaloacetate carboxyltransferase